MIRRAFEELQDGRYLLTIVGAKHRSNNQNSYYWGCVLPLVRAGLNNNGYREIKTNQEAHEVLKYLFLKKAVVNQDTGEVIELLGSTATLTTLEFNEYIEDIARWCSEYLGFALPLPNEYAPMFETEIK